MAFENMKSTGIAYLLGKLKTVFLQIADAVKTVNGEEPDENGNISITSVLFAENLESSMNQRNSGTFIERPTGSGATVEDGEATLLVIRGNSVHTGYVAEVITPSTNAPGTLTNIAVDRDTFVGEVYESGTITITYTTEWSTEPSVYGITYSGTPVNGNTISVVYVAEERGTITVADPRAFVATGWNLYKNTTVGDYSGYARVLRYSDDEENHKFGIDGAYNSLKFSATYDGAKTDLSPDSDGYFTIPSDGYVWVKGGNSTDTAIWMTWDDWGGEDGYAGSFAVYSEDEIDLSDVMTTYFPNGLLKAGTVRDEINLNIGQAVSRVERLTYNATNRATAEASGREYEFDEDYIYLARAATDIVPVSIEVSGGISVNDHGMELFANTDIPVPAQLLYGNNLKNKLERNVLVNSQQTLSSAQQTIVRANIGAASQTDMASVIGWNNTDGTSVDISSYSSSSNKYTAPQNGYVRMSGSSSSLYIGDSNTLILSPGNVPYACAYIPKGAKIYVTNVSAAKFIPLSKSE